MLNTHIIKLYYPSSEIGWIKVFESVEKGDFTLTPHIQRTFNRPNISYSDMKKLTYKDKPVVTILMKITSQFQYYIIVVKD